MAITITQVHPDKLSTRRAKDGRILYSQVVEVKGSGRMIFVAGQVARDAAGNDVGKGDMRAQIAQVGENIKDALEAVGASLGDIVRTTTYVTDIDEYFKHADVRLRYFAHSTPTSTTVEVRRLASPDHLVEIEAFAITS
ncbi:MAG TPA: RidA family protein [Xanthobacteraceae bacterium]|nr:RidA family protein [Xanthobacteraceae bacterium]